MTWLEWALSNKYLIMVFIVVAIICLLIALGGTE
jgi:hypothetical protein